MCTGSVPIQSPSILWKELEHPWVLESMSGLGLIHSDTEKGPYLIYPVCCPC